MQEVAKVKAKERMVADSIGMQASPADLLGRGPQIEAAAEAEEKTRTGGADPIPARKLKGEGAQLWWHLWSRRHGKATRLGRKQN